MAFDDVDAMTLAERQREEARSERQQRQREEKLGKVLTEISGKCRHSPGDRCHWLEYIK